MEEHHFFCRSSSGHHEKQGACANSHGTAPPPTMKAPSPTIGGRVGVGVRRRAWPSPPALLLRASCPPPFGPADGGSSRSRRPGDRFANLSPALGHLVRKREKGAMRDFHVKEAAIYQCFPKAHGSAARIGHRRGLILMLAANHLCSAACAEKARMTLFSASLRGW